MTVTPCYGQYVIFDSTEPSDHAIARELCAVCPLIDACAANLANLIATAGYYGHPEGTWAGQLLTDCSGRNHVRRLASQSRAERLEREEAAFSDWESREAHAAYTSGDKSVWAATGHRVYGRRQKRAQRLEQAS